MDVKIILSYRKFLRELCHALIEIWHMLLAQVNCGGNVCYPMVLAKY